MTARPTIASMHAVQRYIERHHPDLGFAGAHEELLCEAITAVLHEHPAGEDPIWRTASGLLLVVSEAGEIRTVLPAGAMRTDRRPRK